MRPLPEHPGNWSVVGPLTLSGSEDSCLSRTLSVLSLEGERGCGAEQNKARPTLSFPPSHCLYFPGSIPVPSYSFAFLKM